METNILYFRLLVLLSAVSLCGCSNDDEPVATATDGTTLTVTARADGFASTDGTAHTGTPQTDTPQTRASESGYTTTFVKDDQIGVFAVKGGSVITDCQNVPFTYNGTSWNGSTPVYKYPDATYFAYYPYTADMNDKTSVDAIVSAFNTAVAAATDQSTYAKYTACDLMTTTRDVSPTGSSLSFSFTHKMSLIEISLPAQKYKTSDDTNAYEYSAPVLGATFSLTPNGSSATTIKPCPMGNGIYRYIVPAGTSGATVSGAFNTADGMTIEYSKSSLSLSAGNYKRLNVTYSGAPSTTPTVRALAVGDYYYSDGGIVPKNASNPPSEGRIGIVMKVGKDDSGDWKDDCQYKKKDGSTTINGYVLALHDANGGDYCQWGSCGIKVEHTDMNRNRDTGFYGYKNTQAIISFNESKSGTLSSAFPATYYATVGYEASYPAPANSSGWFLPSVGQCKYWLNNRDTLLESVKKATGNSDYNWKSYYWSSSEDSGIPTDYVRYVHFIYKSVDGNRKDSRTYVRSCLAF